MNRAMLQIYILEWGQGTCTLTKHTRRWTYSALRYFLFKTSAKLVFLLTTFVYNISLTFLCIFCLQQNRTYFLFCIFLCLLPKIKLSIQLGLTQQQPTKQRHFMKLVSRSNAWQSSAPACQPIKYVCLMLSIFSPAVFIVWACWYASSTLYPGCHGWGNPGWSSCLC